MDDNQGQTIEERIVKATTPDPVEVENQPSPTPSENQQQTEEVSTEAPAEQGAEDEEQEALDNSKNPERTKIYIEKLKAQLAEAQAKPVEAGPSPEYGTSVFDTFQTQQTASQPSVGQDAYGFLNQQKVDSITSQFVDAEGNVDINGLNQALKDANDRAYLNQIENQNLSERMARMEESTQVKEAHAVFPEIDPLNKEKFDPKFFNLVKLQLVDNWKGGKKPTLLEAAKYVRDNYLPASPVNLDKVKDEAVATYKQTQEQRNQGPISNGRGEPRDEASNLQELRERSRRGDYNAIAERVNAVINSSKKT